TMPAGTSRRVGSSATRLAEGTTVCPFFSKKLRKRRAISADSIDALLRIFAPTRVLLRVAATTRSVDDNGGGLVVPRLSSAAGARVGISFRLGLGSTSVRSRTGTSERAPGRRGTAERSRRSFQGRVGPPECGGPTGSAFPGRQWARKSSEDRE